MTMFLHKRQTSGFTLIELLVVVAIIGVLASTILGSLSSARAKARDASRLTQAKELMKALELYRNKNGGYPCSGPLTATINDCSVTGNRAFPSAIIDTPADIVTPDSSEVNLRGVLGFATTTDERHSLIYYVRSSANDNASFDRSGYTIRVWREELDTAKDGLDVNDWCKITTGQADGRTTIAGGYGLAVNEALDDIPDCPVEGIK